MGRHNAPQYSVTNGLKNSFVGGFIADPDQRQIRCINSLNSFGVGAMAGCTLRSEDSAAGQCSPWI